LTTVVRRKPSKTPRKAGLDITGIADTFRRFRELRTAADLAKQQHEKLRDEELMPALISYGQAHGEKGQHLAIDLPEEIDGFVRLVRRANTSRFIDVDKAETLAKAGKYLSEIQAGRVVFAFEGTPAEAKKVAKILKDAGVEDFAPIQTAEAFSQERLMAYHQKHRDKLTEKQLDSLFVEETTYSFFPER
jgi:hypothetical protein